MSAPSKPVTPVKIFFSYSHEDEDLRKKLAQHLSSLAHLGLIEEWSDHKIGPGTEWKGQIDSHLNSAQIILLMISPSFMASRYCYEEEMAQALERHSRKEARVIPILTRPVEWKGTPISELQFLPGNAKPISSWRNRDQAFASIVSDIRKVIEEINGTRPQSSGIIYRLGRNSARSWVSAIIVGVVVLALSIWGLKSRQRVSLPQEQATEVATNPAVPAASNTPDRNREFLQQRLAFATGSSVAILGQSTTQAGFRVFERSLSDLGFAAIKVRELSQSYVLLEKRVRARSISYDDFNAAKAKLLAHVREQLRELAGEPPLAYVGFGYELGSLLIILRYWEQLQGSGDVISTVKERLRSMQREIEKIILPDTISVKLLTMRAEDLTSHDERARAQRVLDDTLTYFDLDVL